MLAVVVTQPIYTSVSDVVGRKTPLYSAFFLFGVGSLVFALAPSMTVVILGRTLQGLGGGGLDVLNEVITADITTLKERPKYLGMLAVPMAAGVISGPIIGALFSEYVSWRWIGWINLPLIAIDVALAFFFLRLKAIDLTLKEKLKRIDWVGLVLFTVGITAFALPLSWAEAMYPWSSWRTILPLAIGFLVLIAFAVYEKMPQEPLFPYRIFESRTAQITLICAFLQGMVLYPLLLYLPLFFQSVKLESPIQSAVSILPLCCLVVAASLASGFAVDAFRRYVWQFWASWALIAAGVGLFSLWNDHTSTGQTAGFQILAGIGLGALFTVPALSMQASAPRTEDQGLSVGIMVSFRLFGALVGLAVGSTTFNSSFGYAIADLDPLPASVAILNDPSQAVGFISNLRDINISPELMNSILDAYRGGFDRIWYILAGFSGLGFVVSLFITEHSLENEDEGRQAYA